MKMDAVEGQIRPAAAFSLPVLLDLEIRATTTALSHATLHSSSTVAFLGAFVHSFPENGGHYRDCAHSQHKTLLSTLFFFICGG